VDEELELKPLRGFKGGRPIGDEVAPPKESAVPLGELTSRPAPEGALLVSTDSVVAGAAVSSVMGFDVEAGRECRGT
jgi:hypothetical protein